jgi:hypothetical protein
MDAEPEVETRERESRVVVKLPMTATTTLMAPLTEKKKENTERGDASFALTGRSHRDAEGALRSAVHE